MAVASTSLRSLIGNVLRKIVLCELNMERMSVSDAGYINQRALISSLFKEDYNRGQIILRLTVIDSLYSTNAAYSYFSFEEMADRIYALGDGQHSPQARQQAARDYSYAIALGGKDDKGLFEEAYGYQKNLSEGSRQMSLLSKYAYYELMQAPERYPLGFPIYDRLAKDGYPLVRKMLGEKDYYSMPQLETPSIEQYVKCLTQLREALFKGKDLFEGYQQFDVLDAYLWRMGKFSDGNLSLLLGREDYERFITNVGLAAPYEPGKTTRKETAAYTAALKADFAERYPAVNGKLRAFDFNELILSHLQTDKDPFAGIGDKAYLDMLLAHWKIYETYRDKPPKRGIPFK